MGLFLFDQYFYVWCWCHIPSNELPDPQSMGSVIKQTVRMSFTTQVELKYTKC